MTEAKYPLGQVLDVKIKRQEEAEKIATEKRRIFDAEMEKLKTQEAKRNEVLGHYQNKLTQLRQVLDSGDVTTTEITQMRDYMKTVKEKLLKEESLVKEQKKKTDTAEEALNESIKIVKSKRLDVDKMKIHKGEWTEETNKELAKNEEKLLDEVGTTMFYGKQGKEKK